MVTSKKRIKGNNNQIRLIVPAVLAVLILVLIGIAVLTILGNFKIIYWPDNLNTVVISIIIPDLGLIIALAQWLHSISSDRKQEQDSLPEQNVQPLVSVPSVASHDLLGTSEGSKSEHGNVALHDEGEEVDMVEAPHVEHFYGRLDELATIKRWIVDEQCRLVSIIGVGGIGKTSLVARLIDQERHVFRAVFWRSLLNAPPFERVLQECLQFLTRVQQIEIPQGTEEQMRLLLVQLRERRSLLVLDNAEAVLKSGSNASEYKDGYEEYGKLIRLLGETRHQSCLLVTSREQMKEITWLEGEGTSVHSYRLGGINVEDARVMLERKGLSGDEHSWRVLVERFSGNPMMLMFISPTIRESYRGLVSPYLEDFGDVSLHEYPDLRVLLDGQFVRLSQLEQQIIYWLAIERESVTLHNLCDNSVQPVSKARMLTAIEALQRRSWIEQSGSGRFTLQPAMMDAVTDRFTELIVQEIISGKSDLFASHALLKAQAKAYIRGSQFQLILNVIAQKLFSILSQRKLEETFRQRLVALRNLPERQNNYEAGNILNLLIQTGCDLSGIDFSRLVVRQAYLQEVNLSDVNFAHADLATSVFTDTFGSILSVALSPYGDLLAAGTATGEIRLWHAASGLPLQTLQGHTSWVCSIAFNPDGKTLASGSDDQTVCLWEMTSGKLLHTFRDHSHWVRSVAFSPDGKILASGSYDQTVCLWEVSSGKSIRTLHGHSHWVWSVVFSPDGKILASSSEDQTVCLWEVSSGECLNTLQGHTSEVLSVAFSPDGKTLASGSYDQTVRLWGVSNGQCINILQGHAGEVWSVAFSPDGKILASGGEDQKVRLWDVGGGQCLNTLQGHANTVKSLAFSFDGKLLASGSYDQTVRLWEMSSGRPLHTLQGHVNGVFSVAFSSDGRTLASGSEDQIIRLWEVSTGRCFSTLCSHSHWVWSVAFSPDGKTLASGSYDQTVCLWDVSSGKLLHTLRDHANVILSVVFSPDGRTLASGSKDRMVRLWKVSSGQCFSVLQGHDHWVCSVVFSPDDRLLASSSYDQTVRLWEMSSGQLFHTLQGHTGAVFSVVFSPDGKVLASGSDDRTVRLWEVSSGQCFNILQGHTGAVWSVAFSPDGKTLATGSNDQTVRLWEVSSGQCFDTLQDHASVVSSVVFSPNGKLFASSSDDGVINLWDWQSGTCLRTLRSGRPYERMNITQVKGLTDIQKSTIKLLGAIEDKEQ